MDEAAAFRLAIGIIRQVHRDIVRPDARMTAAERASARELIEGLQHDITTGHLRPSRDDGTVADCAPAAVPSQMELIGE